MSAAQEFLKANAQYAATFGKAALPIPPARRVAVIACMDARLDPAKALGLEEGDAHVIRNAGGRAPDALRSLIISQQLLGTREIVVVQHTDCGMLTVDDAALRRKVREELGHDADMAFLSFGDLDQNVRDDVAFLSSSPLLIRVPVTGFVYDVKTGRLREVASTVP